MPVDRAMGLARIHPVNSKRAEHPKDLTEGYSGRSNPPLCGPLILGKHKFPSRWHSLQVLQGEILVSQFVAAAPSEMGHGSRAQALAP